MEIPSTLSDLIVGGVIAVFLVLDWFVGGKTGYDRRQILQEDPNSRSFDDAKPERPRGTLKPMTAVFAIGERSSVKLNKTLLARIRGIEELGLTWAAKIRTTTKLLSLNEFLRPNGPTPFPKQVTILIGDIVGSTETLVAVGDMAWMELVSAYHDTIRSESQRFEGQHLATAGDGFFAAFPNAANALYCACAILRSVKSLGLKLRLGLHAGECLETGEQLVGLTIHVGARIAATAGANEVLVSDSVKSQLTDASLLFLDRGSHNLKGVPGEWRLFAALVGA